LQGEKDRSLVGEFKAVNHGRRAILGRWELALCGFVVGHKGCMMARTSQSEDMGRWWSLEASRLRPSKPDAPNSWPALE
jgi:hypothetical protein